MWTVNAQVKIRVFFTVEKFFIAVLQRGLPEALKPATVLNLGFSEEAR